MKVKGDNAPSGAFEVEPHPQKPGVAVVRFFETRSRLKKNPAI